MQFLLKVNDLRITASQINDNDKLWFPPLQGHYPLSATVTALTQVAQDELVKEQQRLHAHRARFRLHTRSVKQSRGQLNQLVRRWNALPATRGP